jgi:small-conductance mechanosensitive channel
LYLHLAINETADGYYPLSIMKHFFTILILCATLAGYAQPIDTIAIRSIPTAPVAPFGDTLFLICGQIGALTPMHRAKIISDNIVQLRDDPFFEADSLKININMSNGNHNIVYGGKVILAVTREQAQYYDIEQTLLAQRYSATIGVAVTNAGNSRQWLFVLLRILIGIVVVSCTYLLIKYLNRLYRHVRVWVRRHKDKTFQKLYYILDANMQIHLVLLVLKAVRVVFVLLIIYVCMLGLFSLIPATRWLSDTLLKYILVPLKSFGIALWEYVPDLIAIIIIVIIFRYIIKTIKMLADRIAEGKIIINGFYPEWTKTTFNIVRALLGVFMLILIFPHLPNSNSDAFKGISVFMGLLLSLGSTSIIGNLIAGLVITYMRPFHIGDRIRVGENFGDVVEKTSLVTRIKTVKNEIVTIPNSIILSSQTINYTDSAKQHGLILHSSFTMGYDVPWRKVHELLIEAALKTPNTLQNPPPFVLQQALDDFYVRYEINVYTGEASKIIATYSLLHASIQDVFNREGIELIAPPTYELRQADHVQVPPGFVRSNATQTPPFRVAK